MVNELTVTATKRDELLGAIEGKARGENLFVVAKPLGEDTIEVKLYLPAWTKATRDHGVRIHIAPEWR
jgi:hypothetical protein